MSILETETDPSEPVEITHPVVTMHTGGPVLLYEPGQWKSNSQNSCCYMSFCSLPSHSTELCLVITSALTRTKKKRKKLYRVPALKTSLCPPDFQRNKAHLSAKDLPGQEVTLASGTNMASGIIWLHSTFAPISPPKQVSLWINR